MVTTAGLMLVWASAFMPTLWTLGLNASRYLVVSVLEAQFEQACDDCLINTGAWVRLRTLI